ncbi:hypothetical protein [Paenibacillus sp. GCM10023250]|uniref:hypothetical protein n=1 Tax=Paenibacillus sp. GCM10023250 TaxID=3252648 RepID=UPI00360C8425
MVDIDKHVRDLVDALHLDDDIILKQFNFALGERELTREEALRFLAFLRSELNAKR